MHIKNKVKKNLFLTSIIQILNLFKLKNKNINNKHF